MARGVVAAFRVRGFRVLLVGEGLRDAAPISRGRRSVACPVAHHLQA